MKANNDSNLDLRDLPVWADEALSAGDMTEKEAYALLASGERAAPMYRNERCEDAPCCGCCPSSQEVYDQQPYGGWEGCWAGDGSGMDDLADFNAMEGMDM